MEDGINEAMTEFINKKRNIMKNKYEKNSRAYPILTMELENLVYLIGEEELLECYFNNPTYIEELLLDNSLDPLIIMDAFDEILKKENKIYKLKNKKKSREEKMLEAIFGENKNSSVFEFAGEEISKLNNEYINYLLRKNKNNDLSSLESIVTFISRLYYQECGLDEFKVFHLVLEKVNKLKEAGYKDDDINNVIEENDLTEKLAFQKSVDELLLLNRTDLLIKMYEDEYGDDYDKGVLIDDIIEKPSYRQAFKNYLYCNRDDENVLRIRDVIELGKLLKEHPELDFNDLTYKKYKTDERGCNFSVIVTSNEKKYVLYNEEFIEVDENGTAFLSDNRGNNKTVIKLVFDKDEVKMYRNNNGNYGEILVKNSEIIESNLSYLKKQIDQNNEMLVKNSKKSNDEFNPITIQLKRRVEELTDKYEEVKKEVEERRKKYLASKGQENRKYEDEEDSR